MYRIVIVLGEEQEAEEEEDDYGPELHEGWPVTTPMQRRKPVTETLPWVGSSNMVWV